MAYIHIMAYEGLKPMPNVSVHPDGYVVDQHGDVVKRAICPIPGDSTHRIFDGLTPGMVYSFESGLRVEMCTTQQRLNFMEALAEFAGYKPVSEGGLLLQRPYTQGAYAKCAGPFWELITLTTNRVIVGPVVSNKLYRDLANDKTRAKAFDTNLDFQGGFYQQYMCWMQAFQMASNNGLVNIY